MDTYLHLLGVGAALWLWFGVVVGLLHAVANFGWFFSSGLRAGPVAAALLSSLAMWPWLLHDLFVGRRSEVREFERNEAIRSRQALAMYRYRLKDGRWYQDVFGRWRKFLTDASGRNYDPQLIGYAADRIREADYPCIDGKWLSGSCPLCGAPVKGESVCGMRRTEFVGVPQYSPPARPMRDAPLEGRILAVTDGMPDGSSVSSEGVRFHEVEFRSTAPGEGRWIDRNGTVVDGLHGWWTLPHLKATQSTDGIEEPHRWLGEAAPEAYDSTEPWDERLRRHTRKTKLETSSTT